MDKTYGCGCGAPQAAHDKKNHELRSEAAKIVAGVEGYSAADHTRRAAEVKAAFPPKTVAKATKTAAKATKPAPKPATKHTSKPAAKKGPTPAGISKGPHSGDMC